MLLLAAPTVSLHCTATVRKHRPLCAARLWKHSLIMKPAQGRLDQVFGSPCCAALDTVTSLGGAGWLRFAFRTTAILHFIGAQNILQLLADCLESIFSVPVHPEGTLSGGDLVTAETLWAQWTHFTCEKTSRQKLSQNTKSVQFFVVQTLDSKCSLSLLLRGVTPIWHQPSSAPSSQQPRYVHRHLYHLFSLSDAQFKHQHLDLVYIPKLSYCHVIGCVFALTCWTSVPYKVSSEYNCWGAKITTHFMLFFIVKGLHVRVRGAIRHVSVNCPVLFFSCSFTASPWSVSLVWGQWLVRTS